MNSSINEKVLSKSKVRKDSIQIGIVTYLTFKQSPKQMIRNFELLKLLVKLLCAFANGEWLDIHICIWEFWNSPMMIIVTWNIHEIAMYFNFFRFLEHFSHLNADTFCHCFWFIYIVNWVIYASTFFHIARKALVTAFSVKSYAIKCTYDI